eukprot:99852_1
MSQFTTECKTSNNKENESPTAQPPFLSESTSTNIDTTPNKCTIDSIDISNLTIDEKSDDDDDITFSPLELIEWASIDEEVVFAFNGYKQLHKICDVLQGELYKGIQLSSNKFVAIKRTDKSQYQKCITIQNNFSFLITENRIKESVILKHLTVNNRPIGDYIINFIDFFESTNYYYLVTEYINTETNLKQFIQTAHKYIANGILPLKQYLKVVKYLLWQLAVTIKWLHVDMSCVHLDICPENILLENCNFVTDNNGKVKVNPAISIKLADFGVAELFKPDRSRRNLKGYSPFCCLKQNLTLDNESFLAPQICKDELYDARSADIWSYGMVLFECFTGKKLYNGTDVWKLLSQADTESVIAHSHLKNGYLALMSNALKKYIVMNNLSKYFNIYSFDLLINLLNMNENKRISAYDLLKHKWFAMYYKRYRKQIEAKYFDQQKQFIENRVHLKYYDFYYLKNECLYKKK